MKKVVMLTGAPKTLERMLFFGLHFELTHVDVFAYVRISNIVDNSDEDFIKNISEVDWIKDCTVSGHIFSAPLFGEFVNKGLFDPVIMTVRFYLKNI